MEAGGRGEAPASHGARPMKPLLLYLLLSGCATSPTPTNVVTDGAGRQHEVLHSEFGATVLP